MTYDDDDRELTRCVVEQWIDNKDDDFYETIMGDIRKCLERQKNLVESMSILKPYAFVLEDEDHESLGELYLVDDELVIIDPELMKDLDKDLDSFFDELMKS